MRAFINSSGKKYKAEEPNDVNDCEYVFTTPEMLDALTDIPITEDQYQKNLIANRNALQKSI